MTLDLGVNIARKGAETVFSAVVSDDGLYRYQLTRSWGEEPPMTFVMLNPSTADAENDDPTIRRCIGFAKREGCGGIDVVNLFGLRVTKPKHLFDFTIADDYNGPENVDHVRRSLDNALTDGSPIVIGWGAIEFKKCYRSDAYRKFFSTWPDCDDYGVQCLGKSKDGSPRHPLMVKLDAPLERWPQ